MIKTTAPNSSMRGLLKSIGSKSRILSAIDVPRHSSRLSHSKLHRYTFHFPLPALCSALLSQNADNPEWMFGFL
jgi:hypothetical protein